MRLLYIHQYFVTPQESAATRSYWFARELVERGHEVTVITGARGQGGDVGRPPRTRADGSLAQELQRERHPGGLVLAEGPDRGRERGVF